MRYRLRTLLIVLAIGPPILAGLGWPAIHDRYDSWRWREALAKAKEIRNVGGAFVARDK